MDDLEFVATVEGRIKTVEALALLSPGERREKRLCAMVRARDETISDAAKENSRIWNWGAECQAKLETYKVRFAKHEEAAIEAIEALSQEDAVE